MKFLTVSRFVATILIIAPILGRTGDPATTAKKETTMHATATVTVNLESPAFPANSPIPKDYTGDGKDVSPELKWSNIPPGTKSLAVIMDDPDAPVGTWVHWVIYDIPGNATSLKSGLPHNDKLPDGSKQGLAWGVDKFEKVGYHGPYPPPGKPHRYFFKLYALDKTLGLPPKATKPELVKAMQGHILGQGELIGTYKH